MNGTLDYLADSSLTDKELLNQFKMIEKMTEEKSQWLRYSSMHSSPRIKSNSSHYKQKAPEEPRLLFMIPMLSNKQN